jgi:hypothetical protein
MNIFIKTIPHSEQRYPTCGDWWFIDDTLQIRVSNLNNKDYEALLAMHELSEALLCEKRGIKEKDVTIWDGTFEKAREDYPEIFGDTEPGDHPKAPYNKEHMFASRLEHSVAMELGILWEDYISAVNKL